MLAELPLATTFVRLVLPFSSIIFPGFEYSGGIITSPGNDGTETPTLLVVPTFLILPAIAPNKLPKLVPREPKPTLLSDCTGLPNSCIVFCTIFCAVFATSVDISFSTEVVAFSGIGEDCSNAVLIWLSFA